MIPKKIHYCWFGGAELPDSVKHYIASWKKYCPDYEIIEWNEKNYDLSKINILYVQQALENKKWAFVTDFVRLDVLYRYGGIYLDTDIEIVKSFNELLRDNGFIGIESNSTLCTAVIGAVPKHPDINKILNDYNNRTFNLPNGKLDMTPNSKVFRTYFSQKYNICNFEEGVKLEYMSIYPQTYFSPINFTTKKVNITKDTFTIHHYNGTWKSNFSKRKDFLSTVIAWVFGEKTLEILKKKF